jgi:hypothetical protein
MKKIALALTTIMLISCSTTKKEDYKSNTFIIKPINIEHGQGDKRITLTYVNEFNIEKKVSVLFDGDGLTEEFDLCSDNDFTEQIDDNVRLPECPFQLALQHFTGNQYRTLIRATFLNGFKVDTERGKNSYTPLTQDKSYDGILTMENKHINISLDKKEEAW